MLIRLMYLTNINSFFFFFFFKLCSINNAFITFHSRLKGIEAGTFRRLGSHPQDNKDLYEKFPQIDEAIRLVSKSLNIECK